MGFKPMTKYFPAFKISNKKAYEILRGGFVEYHRRHPTAIWLS